jgi:hypothetical protein
VVDVIEGSLIKHKNVPVKDELPDLPPEEKAWEDGLPEGTYVGTLLVEEKTVSLRRQYETAPLRIRIVAGCTRTLEELRETGEQRVQVEGTIVGRTIYVKRWT